MQRLAFVSFLRGLNLKKIESSKEPPWFRYLHHKKQQMADGYSFDDPKVIKFLEDAHKLMVEEALVKGSSKGAKIVDFVQPHLLENKLDLTITEQPEADDKILDACKKIIKYSIKTSNNRFYNQLYGGVDHYGLAGSFLTDVLNSNLHTYEVSPVFVTVENFMCQKLCKIIGYENGDGIFGPGGSFMNILGIHLARFRACPNIKEEGLYGQKKMILYTSDAAHYSLQKGASFLGFGTSSIEKVKTDDMGCMIPEELDKKIEESKSKGHLPLFVMATSGTTVFGAYDPLDKIADVCQRHGVWSHTDACWGGGALLTKKYREPRMTGVERMDSVSWNLHKMSGALLQCSSLLVKDKDILIKCNGTCAEYLFQPDKIYDVSYDVGDKTIQCGRKVDTLKLWLMWKARGDSGISERVERAFDNASYLTERLRTTEGFRLVRDKFQCTNICFWYIPPSLRGQSESPEWWQKLSKVGPAVKAKMVTEGTMMIGYTPLSAKGLVNFFRIIVGNPLTTHEEMDFVLEEIHRLGKDL
ncbi:hypothetical protein ScPMuIL_011750 [Solemya velum]